MLIFKKDLWHKMTYMPWAMIFALCLLTVIGLVTLYVAAGCHLRPWAAAQSYRCFLGVLIFFIFSFINPIFYKKYAYVFYGIALFFLFSVVLFGSFGMGAKRWIDFYVLKVQPSEMMKLAMIFALGRYLNDHPLFSWRSALPLLFLGGLPCLLIIRQPDLGTGILLSLIFLSLLWTAGLRARCFVLGCLGIAVASPLLWSFLKPYQKSRLTTFLTPSADPLGAGYQVLQSKISLGSGQIWGRGFCDNIPSSLDFLPEKQTDFIFTTFAETFGFIGSLGLLFTYIFLLWQGYKILWKTRSLFTYSVTVGIQSMLFVHVIINMAMVMGLLPVVGVPLPFLSYGGSSFVTFSLSYGILSAIHIHESLETPHRGIRLSPKTTL